MLWARTRRRQTWPCCGRNTWWIQRGIQASFHLVLQVCFLVKTKKTENEGDKLGRIGVGLLACVQIPEYVFMGCMASGGMLYVEEFEPVSPLYFSKDS